MEPKILLADDHSMICKAVRLILELNFGYTDVRGVATCNEMMKELNKKIYTHLVLDINLSDGSTLEVLPTIIELYPQLKILVFSMQPAEVYGEVLKKQYGLSHYISKTASEEETTTRIRKFFQSGIAPEKEAPAGSETFNPFVKLSAREFEVLHYMLRGLSGNDISRNLNLKHNTISTLKSRIFEKTKTSNVLQLKELANLYNVS
ncbi:MAG TPA: response regulator transcription factor [Puia sp.]|nr:response regulator transcription factor [Puia sp.]